VFLRNERSCVHRTRETLSASWLAGKHGGSAAARARSSPKSQQQLAHESMEECHTSSRDEASACSIHRSRDSKPRKPTSTTHVHTTENKRGVLGDILIGWNDSERTTTRFTASTSTQKRTVSVMTREACDDGMHKCQY
jgi:hypothetical protein